MDKKPLILVTNDDSLSATGIEALILVAKKLGDVVVIAPEKPSSGKSHSVTLYEPLYKKLITDEPGFQVYTCSGMPADCVKMGVHLILDRKPDLVVSGINHGSNSSVSVIYSGTMAAAIEGCMNRINSIGFSLSDYAAGANFEASVKYAEIVMRDVLANGLPEAVCLNVNIPKGKTTDIKGIKVCRQANAAWQEAYVHRQHPHGTDYFWLTGIFKNFEPQATDTDEWALQNNYVSVVPIKTDFTDKAFLNELQANGRFKTK